MVYIFVIFVSLAKCWGDFYVLIDLLTESVILELESTINELSLIFRVCVAF